MRPVRVFIVLILVIFLAGTAHALTIDRADIVVLDDGDAFITLNYWLSPPEIAAIAANLADPRTEMENALGNSLGRQVEIISFGWDTVQLRVHGFADIQERAGTITMVTPAISFTQAEALIRGQWFSYLTSLDLSPAIARVTFPDSYSEEFRDQISIPSITRTLHFKPDTTEKYEIRPAGVQVRSGAGGTQELVIDRRDVEAAGGSLREERDSVTVEYPRYSLRFSSKTITRQDSGLSLAPTGISLTTATHSAELSKGMVFCSVETGLASPPLAGTPLTTTVSEAPGSDIKGLIRETASRGGLTPSSLAYTMEIRKGSIDAQGSATITMMVPAVWVDRYGTSGDIRAVRIADDRTTELIVPELRGKEADGNLVFLVPSPRGTSIFALVTVRSTVVTEPEQKGGFLTALPSFMRGMVTWLIGCPAGILCVAGIIIIGSTMLMRIQRKRVAIVPGPEPTGPTPPPVPAEPAPLPRAEQLPACPSCGAALRSASRFCGSCGAEIQHEPPVSQARLSVKPAEISPLTCSFCGKAVKPSSRFCGFCGAPVVVAGGGAGSLQPVSTTPSAPVCPVCMSRITPGAKFCGSCGSPLLAQGPSPPALPDRKSGQ